MKEAPFLTFNGRRPIIYEPLDFDGQFNLRKTVPGSLVGSPDTFCDVVLKELFTVLSILGKSPNIDQYAVVGFPKEIRQGGLFPDKGQGLLPPDKWLKAQECRGNAKKEPQDSFGELNIENYLEDLHVSRRIHQEKETLYATGFEVRLRLTKAGLRERIVIYYWRDDYSDKGRHFWEVDLDWWREQSQTLKKRTGKYKDWIGR